MKDTIGEGIEAARPYLFGAEQHDGDASLTFGKEKRSSFLCTILSETHATDDTVF